jgi:Ca2+-binding RTX toxin-like protein
MPWWNQDIIQLREQTYYATSRPEAFYGWGFDDTVSYENAPSSGSIGQYDVGVTVSLENPYINTGLAFGDTFYFIEKIIGSQYTDFMYGDAGSNILDGGGSPDFLYGRAGDDTILGGGGFDFLYGEDGNDVMDGQWHTDTMYGGNGDDQMWGGSNFANHYYPGTNYADILYGDDGNDQLHGDARITPNTNSEYNAAYDFMPGSDELHGGSGNDTLNGDGGDDLLWGDSGADTFQFDAPYTVKDAWGSDFLITSGNDVVMDFNYVEGDRLAIGSQTVVSEGSDANGYLVLNLSGGGSITLNGIYDTPDQDSHPLWFV